MRTLRVLIVENKELVAARLRARLQDLGHEVVAVAKDARQAVASAHTLRPDLVLMDVRLPGMDGIEATRAILRHNAIPIVLLIAYPGTDLVQQAREAGVSAFLAEPTNGRRLRAAIEVALARFAALQATQHEGSEVSEAPEIRQVLEQAKKVLMKWLKLSEAEAFRRLQQERRRSTDRNLQEMAWTISQVDRLLLETLDVRCLELILRAIDRGLKYGPEPHVVADERRPWASLARAPRTAS